MSILYWVFSILLRFSLYKIILNIPGHPIEAFVFQVYGGLQSFSLCTLSSQSLLSSKLSVQKGMETKKGLKNNKFRKLQHLNMPYAGGCVVLKIFINEYWCKYAMHTHTHTLMSKDNLERLVYPIFLFLDCGRKPNYLEGTHVYAGRRCKLHAEGSKARIQLSCYNSATNWITVHIQ